MTMRRFGFLTTGLLAFATIAGAAAAREVQEDEPHDHEAVRAQIEEHRERMRALSPFSLVPAPEGVEVRSRGSSEGEAGTVRSWRAVADGEISSVALIEHYANMLEEMGWTFRPAFEEGVVAIRTGEHRDSEGATWHVLVLAAPSRTRDGSCVITFQLTRVD